MADRPGGRDDRSARRAVYHERLAAAGLAPLWTFFADWFAAAPRVASRPHVWRYSALRELVLESAAIIDHDEAERRVAVLENPGLAGRRLATESLYAGLQVIMPGETAPCHRHSPVALRFVVEGSGAFTAIDGERAPMSPGDLIITPAWAWHEHGNDGDRPTVWLDVLDVAMVHLFTASFAELRPEGSPSAPVPPGTSHYRFGNNMRPAGYVAGDRAAPVFCYPYARAREGLAALEGQTARDPCHGLRLEYIDPTTGGPAMPTIATFVQLLPAGFDSAPYRSTAGTIFCVVEGEGRLTIGEGDTATTFDYGPWDIVAAPAWMPQRFSADSETVVFSASDEAAQRKLGFFREQRG